MQPQILVPLDGSPRAEAILPLVVPLAGAGGLGLTLLQIVPREAGIDPLVGMRLPPDVLAERAQATRAGATDYLTDVARRNEAPGRPVRVVVLEGEPAAIIGQYAAEHADVRLIAMATHGRRGLSRWMAGSVAEAVVAEAIVPLLLLRAAQPEPPPAPPVLRTILVPLDGSAFAEQALDQAAALAGALGAGLVLVTAVTAGDMAPVEMGEVPFWEMQERQGEVDRLVLYQQHQIERLAPTGLHMRAQVAEGRPATVINRMAAEVGADLIVMATHGRTGFARLRMGSVALEVVETTDRPVFLLHAARRDAPMVSLLDLPEASAPPDGGVAPPPAAVAP